MEFWTRLKRYVGKSGGGGYSPPSVLKKNNAAAPCRPHLGLKSCGGAAAGGRYPLPIHPACCCCAGGLDPPRSSPTSCCKPWVYFSMTLKFFPVLLVRVSPWPTAAAKGAPAPRLKIAYCCCCGAGEDVLKAF